MRRLTILTGLTVALLASLVLSASAKTTVSVLLYSFPDQVGVFEEIAAQLEFDMPEIEIELVVPPVAEYQEKLITMLATGVAPDVVFVHGNWMTQLVGIDGLLPLNEFIERDGYDLAQTFFPQTLELFRRDGTYFGLPFCFIPVAIAYNETLFNNAGLPTPPATVDGLDNWKWDDFLAAARRIQRRDADGRLITAGMRLSAHRVELFLFPWQNGAEFLNADRTELALQSPEGIGGYQFAVDMIHRYDAAPKLDELSLASFGSGTVGMQNTFQGLGSLAFAWDYTFQPWNRQQATSLTIEGFAVTKTTPHPELAWRVMKYFTGETAGLIHTRTERTRNIPAPRVAATSPEFLELNPYYQVSIASLPFSRVEPGAYTTHYTDVERIGAQFLRQMYAGSISVEQGIEQMTVAINQVLSAE